MADILQTSLSALLTSQRALATTGHNIANVNTPGYSRQRVELAARIGATDGAFTIGSGVQLLNVTRSYDAFIVAAARGGQSEVNRLDAFHSMASRVDRLLGDESTGITASMQRFFGSAQDVANDPSSLSARQVMLGQAESIASRFQSVSNRFTEMQGEISSRMQQEAQQIDALAQSIADVNRDILSSNGSASSGGPNDLLDYRDQLINELATKIDVNTLVQEDGSMNVFVGSGQALVVGTQAAGVDVQTDAADPTRFNVVLSNTGSVTDISSSIAGGTMGGLMDFQREVLDPARNELGRIAIALATAVNSQQASGMDLNGNLGAPLFSIGDPAVVPNAGNSGTGSATATVSDVSALTTADYTLAFNGGAYSLSRSDTGESVPMTGSGTAGDPFVADGLSIVVDGAPANGDRLTIRPTAGAAGALQLTSISAEGLAAAAPVRGASSPDNVGSGSIQFGAITDINNPQLLNTATIEFTSPTTYSINGAGSFPYTEGEPIEINGASFTITGAPEAGDVFTIDANSGGVGDNSNMLALAGLQGAGVLDGGGTTLGGSVSQLVAAVGTTTQQAATSLTAQQTLLDQSLADQQAVQGVNLDEEAANMLRYQQAYEAAARMITVADSLFNSLLNAVGR
ncbi:MAG: flagellar hook-associated protein FlgK [Pseudomonadota bacterium]